MIKVKKILAVVFASLLIAGSYVNTLSAKEVRIAILDSGASKYVDHAVSFTNIRADQDPMGHGTAIAQLIRRGNPTSEIYMLQVCENEGGEFKPSAKAIKSAILWAVENKIDLINMSLVIAYDPEIDQLISRAVKENGIIFVAASGNIPISGRFRFDSQGNVYKNNAASEKVINFPASNPNVISVGGLQKNGRIAGYSPKICDIFADGRIAGQEGSSFASARIAGKLTHLVASQSPAGVNISKSTLLSLLAE